MRLIDAYELKRAIEDRIDHIPSNDYDQGWNAAINTAIDEIDNAPTIEISNCGGQVVPDNLQGWRYEARPRGKWEEDWREDLDFMSRKGWKCPFCKWRTTYGTPNFCMNCGADLREGDEVIKNAPTVIWAGCSSEGLPVFDFRPRPQGEWSIDNRPSIGGLWKCSECNDHYPYKTKFCPHCGALMRGEDHD